MKKIFLRTSLVLVTIVLIGSCRKSQEEYAGQFSMGQQKISTATIQNYFTDGIDESLINLALSGNVKAAEQIFYQQLDDHPIDHYAKKEFWRMIAAENGSSQGMYELAIMSEYCHRRVFWAQKYLHSPKIPASEFRRNQLIEISKTNCNNSPISNKGDGVSYPTK